MKYAYGKPEIVMGERQNDGACYVIRCDGKTMLCGWRKGTVEEILAHLHMVIRAHEIRLRGEIIKLYKNGRRKSTSNGRYVMLKEQINDEYVEIN